jgi:hypothetical protein
LEKKQAFGYTISKKRLRNTSLASGSTNMAITGARDVLIAVQNTAWRNT